MNNFQTILTAIFLAFFVFAVLIFSGLIKIGGSSSNNGALKGKITVWGTLSSNDFYKVFENATVDNQDLYINYIRKDKATYQSSLIEAFASDQGPDLFFITPGMIIKNQNFIYEVPYTTFPERSFKDVFIDGADVYLGSTGVIGFPVVVDPMVMYYNKNMLSNEGIATPPKTWDRLFELNDKLTKKKNDGTILKSMIALGRYDNITNPLAIVSSLLFQSGDPIVKREGDRYVSVLDSNSSNKATSPFKTILNYLIEFSNPSSTGYSWNRSLHNSSNLFIEGKLALYLGKASELFNIQSKNPNLSFDVTEMLQTKNATKRTYGDIYALAINKKSHDTALAYSVMNLLTNNDNIKNFSDSLSLPPAAKPLLSKKPTEPYMYTFYNSAIISHSWANPDKTLTDNIFNELFDNILSNKLDVDSAITKTQGELDQLLK